MNEEQSQSVDENNFPTGPEKSEKYGYIGLKEIESITPSVPMTFVAITFVDKSTIRLHAALYAIINSDTPVEASTEELIHLCLAKQFLGQMTEYDLKSAQVDGVAGNMMNLAVNAHNEATNKLWGNKNSSQVTLQQIKMVLGQ